MNFLWRSQTLPPPARVDHGCKIKVAGLLGQRFLEKIQNGGQRFTLDWLTDWLTEEGHSTNLIGSIDITFLVLIEDKVI